MAEYYLWVKAAHLISIILWAGPMILLPWIFVCIARHWQEEPQRNLLLEKARLVIRRVINIGMIAAFITGIALIMVLLDAGVMKQGWLHNKITLALVLAVFHGLLSRSLRRMRFHNDLPKTIRFYGMIGIAVPLVVVVIVLLVVHKPI